MKFYHSTTTETAANILATGFRDATGTYLTRNLYTGVWLADQPLDENEGANGSEVFVIEIPEAVMLDYEWVEEGKPYREFLAPASLVNQYGPPALVVE